MSAHSPELQNDLQAPVESPSIGSPNGTVENPACPESSRGEQSRRSGQTATDQSAEGEVSRRIAPSFIHNRPDLARHRRKCSICRHPERETIEDLFIHWHNPATIANFIDQLADDAEDAGDESADRLRITWVAIYRHAYAVGLDEVRRRNLRFAFEHILEQAGDITPTSASIMAAARAYAACLNSDGHWNDPPKQVIVTNILKRESETPFAEHATRVTSHESAHAAAGAPSSAPVAEGGSANKSTDIVAAGLSRPPFSDCGGSTPLCHPASPSRDADSPVATAHGTQPTGHAPFTSAEIRIPSNSLITNDREISNR